MENLFNVKDLASPIEDEGKKSTSTHDKEWKTLEWTCLGLIQKYDDDLMFHHILEETTYGALKWLEGMYESDTAIHKVFVAKWFGRLEYKHSTSMVEHLKKR